MANSPQKPIPCAGSKCWAVPRVSKQRRQRQILWDERGAYLRLFCRWWEMCCRATGGTWQWTLSTCRKEHSLLHSRWAADNDKQHSTHMYKVHKNLFIQGAAGATSEEIQFRHKRVWGYVYRWTTFTEIRFLVLSTTQTGAFIFVVFIDKSLGPQSMKCLMYETHVWRAS